MADSKEEIQQEQREQIQRFLDLTGWSATELARRAGVSQTTITRFLNKKVKHALSYNTLFRISAAVQAHNAEKLKTATVEGTEKEQAEFRASVDELSKKMNEIVGELDKDPTLMADTGEAHAEGYKVNVSAAPVETEGLVGDRDLEVYASAQGGPTGMTVTFDPVEWVKRPAPLMGVKGGFGMYVTGDSMEPVYKNGDMILVHPHKPPGRGDDVLIITQHLDGSSAAMVKELVSLDDNLIVLKQHNPKKEFDLAFGEAIQVFKIVGMYKAR